MNTYVALPKFVAESLSNNSMLRSIKSQMLALSLLCMWIQWISGDSLHPRRPQTEEDFMKIGHHEISVTEAIFHEKWNKLHSKRSWTSYTFNNSEAKANYDAYIAHTSQITKYVILSSLFR